VPPNITFEVGDAAPSASCADNGYCDCDDDDWFCCKPGDDGEFVGCCDDAGGWEGGGGKTEEIGGRDTPLTQLLAQTLNPVPQLCIH
jgi:hypothetical protein